MYSPMTTHCRRKTSAALRGQLRLGSRRLLQRVILAGKSTHQCFQHNRTHPSNKRQSASARALARRRFAESSARIALRVSAPVAVAGANSARPAATVRLSCCRLHRGLTTASMSQCSSICSPMHRPCWRCFANAISAAASAYFSCGVRIWIAW